MNNEPKPRDILASHLTADFMAPEKREAKDASAVRTASSDDIEERLMSEESARIGVEVERLLEDAYITDDFRDFIVNTVRKAHAMEDSVAEEISPDRLGLNTPGQSIFDEAVAPEIEARFLRDYFYIIARKHLHRAVGGEVNQVIILQPEEFKDVLQGAEEWYAQYEALHGTDPFEGLDMTLGALAGPEIVFADPKSDPSDFSGQVTGELKKQKDPREG